MTTPAEPVLLGFKDTAAKEVCFLLLNREVHVSVNHVLELVGTGHLALLVHLVDNDCHGSGLLAEVRDLFQTADGSIRRLVAVGVLAVIEALEGINDHDQAFLGIGLLELASTVNEISDERLVTTHKAGLELEALSSHSCLVQAFLCSIEETDVTLLGKRVGNSEHHRGLTGTRFASEESDTRGRESLAANSTVEVVEAGWDLYSEVGWDFDVEDVGTELDVCDVLEVHGLLPGWFGWLIR